MSPALKTTPAYLGNEFSAAAPGHRFGLYFQQPSASGKLQALQQVARFGEDDSKRAQALADRQAAFWPQAWTFPARSVAPLTTGLGIEHPLENGFAFHEPYGLPYLPGSGIKGVLRSAARQLLEAEAFQDGVYWLDVLFGSSASEEHGGYQRGALTFLDAFPILPTLTQGRLPEMVVEIMNPHQADYFQKDNTPPHDNAAPTPLFFLALPPGTALVFRVLADEGRLAGCGVEIDQARAFLQSALELAMEWLGFGAKTALGYGHLELDRAQLERTEREQTEAQAAADREAELAQLSPLQRKIEEVIAQHPNPQDERFVILCQAMEKGAFTAEERLAVASEIRQLMLAAGRWNPDGKGSKPRQKKDHRRSQQVQAWLGEGT